MANAFERLVVAFGAVTALAGVGWLGWTALPTDLQAAFVHDQLLRLPEVVALPGGWESTWVGWRAAASGEWTRFAPVLLGVALLLVGRRGTQRSFRDRRRRPQDLPRGPVASGGDRHARREARRLLREDRPADAADCLLASGLADEAAQLWIEREDWSRVATVYRDHGRVEEAAEYFARARDFRVAGELFADSGDALRAAESFVSAGMHSRAGEMFAEAGDFDRAGSYLRQAGFFREAARAFARARTWCAAAECLEEVLRELARSEPRGLDCGNETEKLSATAAEFYARAGRFEPAVALFERAGALSRAAELAVEVGDLAKAALLFAEAGEPLRAAGVLEASGDADAAGRVRASLHRDEGRLAEAAQAFEELGDCYEAAEIHRERGDYASAAEGFLSAGDPVLAGEMYQRAGDFAQAAAAWEQCGRFAEAAGCAARLGEEEDEARLLVRAGRFLAACEIYERVERPDEAIRALQRVDPGGPEFAEAMERLAAILSRRGQHAVAIATLESVLGPGGGDPSRETLAPAYGLARAYEAHGDAKRAGALYEKILALDYHYRDAVLRLRRLVQQAEAEASSRYATDSELGRGGMGIVYRARDCLLDRIVAYKVLTEALTRKPRALKHFLREAKAAAKLNHPNIVTVYDAGEQDGRAFIAMEFVDGSTLRQVLDERGKLSPAELLLILVQFCDALAYAHQQGVVHRDIKTANLMWTREQKLKIMDFGLARVLGDLRNPSTSVSGTPYYMSPEQTLGERVDARTDLYSMGVMLFELATGHLPFAGGNIPYHHVHTPAPDPRHEVPELPDCIARVLNRCLCKDPEDRYDSALQILDELEDPLRRLGALAEEASNGASG